MKVKVLVIKFSSSLSSLNLVYQVQCLSFKFSGSLSSSVLVYPV